ncbi:MAG: biotin/lipoyl-containing protein [Acidobacteriota bacterium]
MTSYQCRGTSLEVEARWQGDHVVLQHEDGSLELPAESLGGGEWLIEHEGRARRVFVVKSGGELWVHAEGRTWRLKEQHAESGGLEDASDGTLRAPMTGAVVEIRCAEGDTVEKGQVLLVLSAMKMQVDVQAPGDGRVAKLAVAADQQVDGGDVLVELELDDEDSES